MRTGHVGRDVESEPIEGGERLGGVAGALDLLRTRILDKE